MQKFSQATSRSFVDLSKQVRCAEESKLRAPVVGNLDSVYHKHETLLNVQFSQVQLSQWAAGGQSSASLIAKVDQFWEYDGLNLGWDTEVHAAFGLLHRPDEGILLKTDDRIELAIRGIEESGRLRAACDQVAADMVSQPVAGMWGTGVAASAEGAR